MAYSAGSTIAGDVERDRMDMLLSNPVSRSSVVLEKYLSLLVPIVVVNVVVGAVIYVGARLVDDPIPLFDVIAVHALSVPYLLCCAAIGLLASAGMKREGSAQRASMGVVFSLYMVEALVTGTDFDWLGIASPSRYFDTNDILVEGTYDLVGAAILLEASALLLVASLLVFQRRDI
jgi:ABC-2 type transport system permease protein